MQDVESEHRRAEKFIEDREETAEAGAVRVTDGNKKTPTPFGTFVINVETKAPSRSAGEDILLGQEGGGCAQVLPHQKV